MKKTFFIITLIGLIGAGGYFSYLGYIKAHDTETSLTADRRVVPHLDKRVLENRKIAWKKLIKEIRKLTKNFNGTAGIVIKDLDMNWEMYLNKDLPVPSASVVKIPIMLSYFYAANDGKVDLNSRIAFKKSERTPGSGKLQHSSDGQEFGIESLIDLMITESDNTAANMLINYMGIDVLNDYFTKMGLKHTNLSRKMMDFKERKGGVENYTTAGEMAYLLEQLYRGRFINAGISKKCIEILAGQKVNDRIPKKLPVEVVVAHKTGLENFLCHDAGIVYTDKGNFLISVLAKHKNKTAQEAKSVIADISLLTYNYYGDSQ